MKIKDFTSTRAVVYSAMISAIYVALNFFVAPLAYGPLQFRIGNFLYPLVLFNPLYALGFGLGVFFTNLGSPFGPWDFIMMPFVTVLAGLLAWKFKKIPVLGLGLMILIISTGVSIFPLYLGGSIPISVTILGIIASTSLIVFGAWFIIWKPFYGKGLFEGRR